MFLDLLSMRERQTESMMGDSICEEYSNNVTLNGMLLTISKYIKGKTLCCNKWYSVHKVDKNIYNLEVKEDGMYECFSIHKDYTNNELNKYRCTRLTLDSLESSIVLFCNQSFKCR